MMSISGFVWKKLGQKILEQCDLGWWLGLASTCAISGVFIMSSVDCAFAQIISDGTLGNESSQVTGLGSLFIIRGGATRGTNLFHSFDQFSIPTGGLAFFSNNLAIQNIISRVTGSSVSNINGSITARGTANVFLINPNGIILGPNASLNIGGSFAATTANAIQFGDQGFFSASIPNIPPPLLTVNPSAFLFNQIAGQRENSITVQAKLSVPNGRSLLLLGGNVSPNPSSTGRILIDGRMQGNRDALRALNGRVELGGVAEPGTVGLDVDGNSLRLSFPDGLALADVSLTNQANVTANVSGNSSTGGGGIHLEGGQVTLAGESRITAQTGTNQNGGDINIRASQLILQDASQISASTIGEGKGGALTLRASEFVQLSGTDADGNARGLFSNSYGVGDAGELTIETGRLILRDGAQVLAATAPGTEGQGGTLTVNASESVELSGTTPNGYPSRLSTQTDGTGDAGNLTILTRRLIVQDGGQVSAITLGAGQGGTLTVNASDLVELSGTTITPEGLFLGGLATETIDVLTQDTGDAGALTISTRQLIVRDGAKVSAATATSGLGGPLTVNASESVDVSGGGRLTTETRTAADAGDLTITTGQLNVSDRGLVSASTSGEGDGGNLTVNASDSVTLSSNGQLSVATSGAGAAGNLTITTRQLSGQDSAQISASTSGTGTPGNIFVREADSVVLNNSSISTAVNPGAVVNTAGAEQFGNIDIQTRLLSLIDGASVSASTSGQGDAGSIFVRDAEAVSLSDSSISTAVNAGAVGQGGGIDIQTGSLSLNDEAEVSAATFGTGRAGSILVGATDSVSLSNSTVSTETSGASQAGNVRIDTRQLAIQDRGQVSAATSGSGQGGSVEVNASDFVALNSRGRLLSESKGTGFAGDVTLTTPQLTLQSDAEISASTTVSLGGNVTLDGLETLEVSNSRISASTQEGIAGNVTVNATESVQLSGTLEDGTPAGLLAEATAGGNARNLTINTRQLRVEDGAQATVSSTGRGTAGN
ncbi:MAG: filamentous hemagglutinin N-terminal domain-containing protein, partial [Coleofasciculus sp. S288]|nr:filamentous hemagglutinin N-terminal domain-containing protein [Coleofasciculus sp. S288]